MSGAHTTDHLESNDSNNFSPTRANAWNSRRSRYSTTTASFHPGAGDVRRSISSPSANSYVYPEDTLALLPAVGETASRPKNVTRSATSTAAHRTSRNNDAAFWRYGDARHARGEIERPKSILQRLAGPLATPDLRAGLGFSPRLNRYSVIQEMDDFRDGEMANVDISFLEGPALPFETGTVVSAEVRLGQTAGTLLPKSNVNLEVDRGDKVLGSASIRNYGQKLAEETNMIVAVKEISPPAVDLSSLEGQGPDLKIKDQSSTDPACQSYFYPADPEQPNWKPFSMRSLYILVLVVLSLTLAGVQEFLYQRSQRLEEQGRGLIQYNSVSDIPLGEFFCWKYLPTIVMVCYGILWQITDYDVKRLEPYYQLAQPTGNTADKSLNLDYVTLWSYFVPVKAMRYRHWAVFVSSLGTILATTAAPSLLNPSIVPIKNPKCVKFSKECGPGHDPLYSVQIHPVWSRLLTTCLSIVAIFATILLIQLRRKSGLLSDPRGVAGVAAMATKSHILADFQGMDEALHDEIHKKLRRRRYVLYKSTIWQGEYMKQSDEADDPYSSSPGTSRPPNPHPIILRPRFLIAFMVFLSLCLPFIPVITYTELNIVANELPWLPTLIATFIKQLWTTLEFAVKMLEPFYTLSKRNARPEFTLTLDYQGTPYGLLPFKALLNHHYLVALVGFGSILGDVLTVTASSLSLTNETLQSFTASSTLATVILIFLILSATLVFIRRRHPFMPRQPSTIASILAFIYQSRMLEDFDGTERYTNAQMEAMLVAKNKRYGLGWFNGRDHRPHCAVDQEPMLSRYVHGISYKKARAPWEDIGEWS